MDAFFVVSFGMLFLSFIYTAYLLITWREGLEQGIKIGNVLIGQCTAALVLTFVVIVWRLWLSACQ